MFPLEETACVCSKKTLEVIQPLSEESVSFKDLIKTKHGLEDFQSLKAICIMVFKKIKILKKLRILLF